MCLFIEILVDVVDVVLEGSGLDEKFLGVTLFALVPNTTEFMNAMSFAMNGNIALRYAPSFIVHCRVYIYFFFQVWKLVRPTHCRSVYSRFRLWLHFLLGMIQRGWVLLQILLRMTSAFYLM